MVTSVSALGPVQASGVEAGTPASQLEFDELELAESVEAANQAFLVDGAKSRSQTSIAAEAARISPDAPADLTTRRSISDLDQQTMAIAQRLAAGRGISVTDVNVRVKSVASRRGLEVITLHIKRRLQDGQYWEELVPYVAVEKPVAGAGLVPGQVVVADSEAVLSGEVSANLLERAGLPNMLDDQVPLPVGPGSQDKDSSSTTRPPSIRPEEIVGRALSATDRGQVRDYALRYALSPNNNYYLWSNDCTNFVSQALLAGGWSENLGFYQSDGNWWYTGSVLIRASYTWAGAENFYRFARVESGRATRHANVYDLRVGDILQYKLTGAANMTHTMVTTGHSAGVPLLSYHTTNTKNKPFTSISSTGKTWFASKV